jgi:hypothetical protein
MATNAIIKRLRECIQPLKDVNLINKVEWGKEPQMNDRVDSDYPLAFIEYPTFYEYVNVNESRLQNYVVGLFLLDKPPISQKHEDELVTIPVTLERIELAFASIFRELAKSDTINGVWVNPTKPPTAVSWAFINADGVWGYRYELNIYAKPIECAAAEINSKITPLILCPE